MLPRPAAHRQDALGLQEFLLQIRRPPETGAGLDEGVEKLETSRFSKSPLESAFFAPSFKFLHPLVQAKRMARASAETRSSLGAKKALSKGNLENSRGENSWGTPRCPSFCVTRHGASNTP